ncbi:MAG: Phosphoribosylformimino-5-aminoimidazole carboxamide ribotide isomerase [Acidobacteriales bacterium]|nr:Phosphoribosylformimino-5-aminoimidazole carboxamide ribotide isomerase [Terriglobales bacterium]
MLIPSIDLMDGKVVQLSHGESRSLDLTEFEPWLKKFEKYPLVHVTDLDGAMRQGSNATLVAKLTKRLPCQVGGGITNVESARAMLAAGAKRVVLGSALISDDKVDTAFAKKISDEIGAKNLVFSVDTKQGLIAVSGWRKTVPITAEDAIRALEPFCKAFLHTHIDDAPRGSMGGGFPMVEARELCKVTKKHLMVGGGIRSMDEVRDLDALGIDAVVGTAIYSGVIQIT